MFDSLRDSGIEEIGDVPWGTHIGQLYRTKDECFELMVSFVKSGLLNNELCLWIFSDNTSFDETKNNLNAQIPYIDSFINSGQLIIIPYTEWYMDMDGCSFNDVRVNRKWNEYIRLSLQRGYAGLRAVADTAWLKKNYFRSFMHYEETINNIITELPFIVVCLYDAAKLDTFETAKILQNHSYVITKHEGTYEVIKNLEIIIKDKQLEKSREKYRKLISLLPDLVFIHDDKKIYYANEAAYRLAGSLKIKGQSFMSLFDLVADENRDELYSYIKRSLENDDDVNYLQTRIITDNGEFLVLQFVSVKYDYNGSKVLLSAVRDLTPFIEIDQLKQDIEIKKKLLDMTLEYDRMKTEFFSNISHELRTPLNVILSGIQLLKLQGDHINCDEKNTKYLKMMQQNCFRLIRLVNNLIDITKIDADFLELKPQNYHIVALTEEITMSVVEFARSKGIKMLFDTNVEEKITACDPDKIERIILNLLSNAIKFTPKGGTIEVCVCDRGDELAISVKDTGVGIPREKQGCIFKRFQQADNQLASISQGSGIGLSLVSALVEKHGGSIMLESEPGKGSNFIITLPCVILDKAINDSYIKYEVSDNHLIERISIELSDIYA